MRRKVFSTLVVLATALLVSCVGTHVGNPQEDQPEKVEVELNFDGFEETQQNALILDNGMQLHAVWLVLDEFRFRHADNCQEETSFDVAEPIVIDLLAEERSYEAPTFTKVAGEYCQLDLGFGQVDDSEALPEEAPQELLGNSVLVKGRRTDGVKFYISANFGDEFFLDGAVENFRLEQDFESLVVGFALNEWVNTASLDAIEGEDPIVIDTQSHAELLDEFHTAVKRSARLFSDQNRNGRVDPDEQANPIAKGQNQAPNNGPQNNNDQNDGQPNNNNSQDDAGR